MIKSKFWQDVIKTFQALPFKMKVIWLLAPPMCALIMIAYTLSIVEKTTFIEADLVS